MPMWSKWPSTSGGGLHIDAAITTAMSYEFHVILVRLRGAMLRSRRVGMKHALPYRVKAWHPPADQRRCV